MQIYSILQLKNKSRRAKNINKITTNKEEVKRTKKIKIKIKKTKIKTKIIEKSIKTDIKANIIVVITITTTIVNKKCLLRLHK